MTATAIIVEKTNRRNGYDMPIIQISFNKPVNVSNIGYNEFIADCDINGKQISALVQDFPEAEKLHLEITDKCNRKCCWYDFSRAEGDRFVW